MNSYSTLLLFIVLAILQTQTGYMLSDPILRGTSVPSVRTKLRRKEKKATEIFVIYYYIPFTLAALYFFNLKIYDYFLIVGFYWLFLKGFHIFSGGGLEQADNGASERKIALQRGVITRHRSER